MPYNAPVAVIPDVATELRSATPPPAITAYELLLVPMTLIPLTHVLFAPLPPFSTANRIFEDPSVADIAYVASVPVRCMSSFAVVPAAPPIPRLPYVLLTVNPPLDVSTEAPLQYAICPVVPVPVTGLVNAV